MPKDELQSTVLAEGEDRSVFKPVVTLVSLGKPT